MVNYQQSRRKTIAYVDDGTLASLFAAAPETAAERDRLKETVEAIQRDLDSTRVRYARADEHETILAHQLKQADALNAELLEALKDMHKAAASRWRSQPESSFEKKSLNKASGLIADAPQTAAKLVGANARISSYEHYMQLLEVERDELKKETIHLAYVGAGLHTELNAVKALNAKLLRALEKYASWDIWPDKDGSIARAAIAEVTAAKP